MDRVHAAVLAISALFSLAAQPYKNRLGVEIDGFGDAARSRPFVDHARLFRPCSALNGSAAAPIDSDGWPAADAQCVMFDIRAIPAWSPPIDDPAAFQPDWSGAWSLSFEGRAEVGVPSGGASLESLEYDGDANLTRARVIVQPDTGLLILSFRNTRRTPSSEPNSGIRSLHFIRPGYAPESKQIFTDAFLRSFAPFRMLRYMDFTATNSVTPSATPADQLEWSDRHVPSDATQQSYGRKVGVAWEYAVLLANQTGTDLWINIPVSASTDYIRQLARLVAGRLNPGLRIYIEHGNEVWNSLFANSYNYNRNAAVAEVAAGGSNLNNDNLPPDSNAAVFARRRHLRRVIDAVRVFREEMGAKDSPGDLDNWRVRGVFAWWTIRPDEYRQTLNWARSTFGELNQHLYGIASTHYYNVSRATSTDSPERLVEVMTASSDGGVATDSTLRQIASDFGVRHTIYEGGPDVGGGSTTNVGNRILANRLPSMKGLVVRDIKTNWFDRGGYEYSYFSHCGPCSRYGCWGAAEDVVNLDTPKMNALRELSGDPPRPVVTAVVNGADFGPNLAPGSLAVIQGENLAALTAGWDEATFGRALPTMLAGVQVRFNGTPAAVASTGATQLTVVVPSGIAVGTADVEVYNQGGIWRGTTEITSVAPAWFGSFESEKLYLKSSAAEPPAPGDVVDVYATGLGATSPSIPVNEVPDAIYPVADLASIAVTIGGQPAEVLSAGATAQGTYTLRVRIPEGVPGGEQTVELSVAGTAARVGYLLLRE